MEKLPGYYSKSGDWNDGNSAMKKHEKKKAKKFFMGMKMKTA
jgi:hypothetical protein